MNFKEINRLIEERRILTGMSSLPFIVTQNGKKTLAWFNFDVEQSDDIATAHVSKMFVLNDDMSIVTKNISLKFPLELQECAVPVIDDVDYMLKLEQLYYDFNEINILPLISQAVISPLVKVYSEIIKWFEIH